MFKKSFLTFFIALTIPILCETTWAEDGKPLPEYDWNRSHDTSTFVPKAEFKKVGTSLFLILCAAGGILFFARKFGRKRQGHLNRGDLERLATLPLDSKSQLHVIRFGKTKFLLAVNPNSIEVVGDMPHEEANSVPLEPTKSSTNAFPALLKAALNRAKKEKVA